MLANPSSRHLSRLERMASSMADGGGPGLPRSTSVKATPTAPLLDADDDDASHHPPRASISTTSSAQYSRQRLHSINCTAAPADTPADTPKEKHRKPASYYASMWSPRRLMERASRAFRSAGRSRRKKNRDAAAVIGDTDSPRSVASMGSDAASAVSFDEQIVVGDVHGGGAKKDDDPRLEVVPEKIIHEANDLPAVVNHQPPAAAVAAEQEEQERISTPDKETAPAVDDECTKTPEMAETAAAEEEAGKEDELKKAAAPAPEVIAAAVVVAAVTDCKLELAKEAAIKKREEEIMTEVVRRFQGSRVRTSMEKRSGESEQLPAQPRRRASNEVIEEARTKLLEMRHGSRVKALVGAFETVMDANSPRASAAATPTAAGAGKPHLHHVRTSTV